MRYIESLLVLRCSLRLKAKQGAFAAQIGKARHIRSANKLLSGFLIICCASPFSGARIAAPIVLVQHKEHQRIGQAQTSMRRASPIVIKLTY
jgi:hypothetical protein